MREIDELTAAPAPAILTAVAPVRVLLVEDNSFTRSTVASSLSVEGLSVTAAVSSASEAMDSARTLEFDCAVIDLHLGTGPTGIDVAHGVRRHQPGIGVVILTSYADPRLLSANIADPPPGTIYVVKNDVQSTGELHEFVKQAMSWEDSANRPAPPSLPLTDIQVEVLALAAHGLTNAEIAKRRFTTERSVEMTLQRTAQRLGLEPNDLENSRVVLAQAYFELIGGKGPA
mgnify:FL=1